MKTIAKTENAMLTERTTGFAIAIWAKEWSATARAYLYGWKTIATGLTADEAATRFARLPA